MDPLVGAAIISGGIYAVNQLVNLFKGGSDRRKNIEGNKELMNYQYGLDQASLRESPNSTILGMKKAGLSPAAMSSGTGISAPSVSSQNVNTHTDPSILDPSAGAKFLEANNIEADTNLKNAQAAGIGIENSQLSQRLEADYQKVLSEINLNSEQTNLIKAKIDEVSANIIESTSRVDLNKEQIQYLQTKGLNETWDMLLKDKETDAVINELNTRANLNRFQSTDLLFKVYSGYWDSVVRSNNAQAYNYYQDGKLKLQVAIGQSIKNYIDENTKNEQITGIRGESKSKDAQGYVDTSTKEGKVSAENNRNQVYGSKTAIVVDYVLDKLGEFTNISGSFIQSIATAKDISNRRISAKANEMRGKAAQKNADTNFRSAVSKHNARTGKYRNNNVRPVNRRMGRR